MKNSTDYIFTVTLSGDRTNIMSSFPLWDKEMFLSNVKQGKNYGRYRYGKIGGCVSLLKDMYLEEFDLLFSPDEFTSKEITQIFRKEISEKYGEHAEKAKIKPLTKSQLKRGHFYLDFNDAQYLYLGEVEKTYDSTYYKHYQSDKKPVGVTTGSGFHSVYRNDEFEISPCLVDVLKSNKKLKSVSNRSPIGLENWYEYETGEKKSNWGREYKVTLKLL